MSPCIGQNPHLPWPKAESDFCEFVRFRVDGDDSTGEELAKARVPQDGPEGALRREIGSSSSSDELLNGCIAEFLPPSEQKVFIEMFSSFSETQWSL